MERNDWGPDVDERIARLRAAITAGDAQLARGEGSPFSAELMDAIEREADEAVRRGDQPNSDVCPSSTGCQITGDARL